MVVQTCDLFEPALGRSSKWMNSPLRLDHEIITSFVDAFIYRLYIYDIFLTLYLPHLSMVYDFDMWH